MTPFNEMQIYLLDINEGMCDEWKLEFRDTFSNVSIINMDFYDFMQQYDIDAVVSPANSFGLMTGGYDKAIADYYKKAYGCDIIDIVQSEIMRTYAGEQPICTSLSVWVNEAQGYLIHTPTMRVPSITIDSEIVYHCTRSCILEAQLRNARSVVIPAFCAGTGEVYLDRVAFYMKKAVETFVKEPMERPTWKYIYNNHPMHEFDDEEFAKRLYYK